MEILIESAAKFLDAAARYVDRLAVPPPPATLPTVEHLALDPPARTSKPGVLDEPKFMEQVYAVIAAEACPITVSGIVDKVGYGASRQSAIAKVWRAVERLKGLGRIARVDTNGYAAYKATPPDPTAPRPEVPPTPNPEPVEAPKRGRPAGLPGTVRWGIRKCLSEHPAGLSKDRLLAELRALEIEPAAGTFYSVLAEEAVGADDRGVRFYTLKHPEPAAGCV